DRSLLVPAEKVWQTRSGILTFLKRRFENPQERLLADLGKTARLFPAIEESLKTASPVGLALDTNGAYTFLRQSAPLLEQSGFGVLLPPWWQKPAVRLGVKLKVKPKAESKTTGAGLLGVGGIVNYNWQVALGDQTLSPEEFEKLAALKVPLVRVRGQWVELNPAEIEAAIAFFKERHREGEMTLSEAMRLGLGQERSEVGLPVVGIEAAGWVGDLLNRVSGDLKITVLKSPRTFRGRLRPYQIKGFSWLVFLKQFGFGACLADDMGLGKTIQFIALMLHERITRRQKLKPTLLICPTSIVGNWHREIERFGPSLKVMLHHGTDRLSGKAFEKKVKKHNLVISTYALAHRDKELFSAVHWQCVALDEAQNIKNPAAKQTQAIRKIHGNYRVALTGTPVENRLSELWSIMEFLNPGYLGSAKDFRTRFAVPIERYRNRGQAETLKHLIQPFVLRRMKSDPTIINDLPEKMEMKVFCNLTGEQASLYQAVVDEMMEKIEDSEGIERKGLVLSTLMKLKQVCNHPAQFVRDRSTLPGRSGKLTRLVEMLEEVLEEDNKALIFTQFAEMGTMLRHHLQETTGVETLFLHGGTPRKQRDRMVQRFQADRHGPPLFILSLKAGGLGLNLTAANQVFHFDRWWNPAVENQATDRAFRIGQKKNVQVYKFVCIGTLEERIDQMIEQKKELAESIVGTGEAWLTEMSTEQLKEIFTLSREAVGE
ncbi:MAG: DEAD/DEAH box helicase, partial [Candidatus Latescibacteria bacterium]|nr:DEAD/DEAH box helicase [Candidatus Latescibacterota bacterium]